MNLLAYFIVHPMCGNLPSAVICLKSTLSVFVPLYSLFAMTRDASRRKVKWGNHSRLKKTEKETSIHFQRFINNCIIPPPQGFFIFYGHSVGYTNPQDFCLIFSSHIVCQKNLSYKNGNTNLLWLETNLPSWTDKARDSSNCLDERYIGQASGTIHSFLWRHR